MKPLTENPLTVNIVTFDVTTIDVTDICLPDITFFEAYKNKIPFTSTPWWTKDCCCIIERAQQRDPKKKFGIRPVMYFRCKKLEEKAFKINDAFIIKGCLFRCVNISGEIVAAITEAPIAFSQFSKNGSSNYTTSDIKIWLDNWVKEYGLKSNNLYVGKVTKKTPVECKNYELTAFPFSELNFTAPPFELSNGFCYWLRGRYDEFTGFYIDEDGKCDTTDNTNKNINVCPFLKADALVNTSRNILLEINGTLFVKIDNTWAKCLTPIGKSCYNSEIVSLDECTENEHYKLSDVCGTITVWLIEKLSEQQFHKGGTYY